MPRAAHFAAGPRRPRAEHPGRTGVRGGWGGSARSARGRESHRLQAEAGRGACAVARGQARSPVVGKALTPRGPGRRPDAAAAAGGASGGPGGSRGEAPGAHPLGVEPQVSPPRWDARLGDGLWVSRAVLFLVRVYLGALSFRRGCCWEACGRRGLLARGHEGCLRGGGTSGPSPPVHIGDAALGSLILRGGDCFFHL